MATDDTETQIIFQNDDIEIIYDVVELKNEFQSPTSSDYIECKSEDHKAENCNAMHRIVHILNYYHQKQQVENV